MPPRLTVKCIMPIKRFNIVISIIKDKLNKCIIIKSEWDDPRKADHLYLLASSYKQKNPKVCNRFMRFSELYVLGRYTPRPISNGDMKKRGDVADITAC